MNGHLEAEERQDQVRVYESQDNETMGQFSSPLVPVPWSLSHCGFFSRAH